MPWLTNSLFIGSAVLIYPYVVQARLLLTNAVNAQTVIQKGSLALALGCIHRRYFVSYL